MHIVLLHTHLCRNAPRAESMVGAGFKQLMMEPVVSSFMFDTPPSELLEKDIYEHGSLRKVVFIFLVSQGHYSIFRMWGF